VPDIELCPVADLADGKARRFDGPGYRLAVVRIGDEVFAVADECSHQDYSLSEGEVDPDECTLECWKHGSTFDLRTGEPQTLPATQSVAVYPVTVRDGTVVVTL
jgi:3-phenylpropionate/trans-cinnamate dioxygenase ferredoxin subunit